MRIKNLYICYKNKDDADSGTCFYTRIEDYSTDVRLQRVLHDENNTLLRVAFLDRNDKIIKSISLDDKSKSEVICELDSYAFDYLYN